MHAVPECAEHARRLRGCRRGIAKGDPTEADPDDSAERRRRGAYDHIFRTSMRGTSGTFPLPRFADKAATMFTLRQGGCVSIPSCGRGKARSCSRACPQSRTCKQPISYCNLSKRTPTNLESNDHQAATTLPIRGTPDRCGACVPLLVERPELALHRHRAARTRRVGRG